MSDFSNSFLATAFTGKTTEGDAITATSLNVTKIVSFFVAIFAGIMQVLDWADKIKLSATQMVTIWLVVAGFIVLLSVTDMICRAYATAKRFMPGEASVTELKIPVKVQKETETTFRTAELIGIAASDSGQFAHIKWKDGRADDGKETWVPLIDIHSPN